ncbi:M15 family metallopeptidase [Bacillus sp. 2205SS5-2]|uniref:M15 family metallopeptidase n=1 Tax=Bacillus sp. 2205SS5-2 TaxID=3109031 RepID=UPI0030071608
MKFIVGMALSLSLLFLGGCTALFGNSSTENESGIEPTEQEPVEEENKEPLVKEQEPETPAEPPVNELVTSFYESIIQETDEQYVVKKFSSKTELVQYLVQYAKKGFAQSLVDTYYKEENGKLKLVPQEAIPHIDPTLPFQLNKINETEYQVTQDQQDELFGSYTIEASFEVDGDHWVIAKSSFTQTKPTLAENHDSEMALINKQYFLPNDYIPADLIEPNVPFTFEEDLPKKLLVKEAALALEEMFAAAKNENVELLAASGYRSFDQQKTLFAWYADTHGEEEANKFSARAGQSEHQSGLAMDVSSKSVAYDLTEAFGETPEGKWVATHAAEYGFIVRYPKGKEAITGYKYEPWHLRYVGKEMAREIESEGLTLEEYTRGM